MRNSLIALLCFMTMTESFGQATTSMYGKIDVEITKEKRPKRIYAKVEIKSPFIGGDSSWVRTIEKRPTEQCLERYLQCQLKARIFESLFTTFYL